MKKFCVLTTGRSGSTALMDALAAFDDIGLPNRQFPCDDNELLNPKRSKATVACYSKLSGERISTESALFEAYFRSNSQFAFAGFKSMPLRHQNLDLLTLDQEIQVITIYREDIYSTAASFLTAARFGTWRREGEPQTHRLRFESAHEQMVDSNVAYLAKSFELLSEVQGAIRLRFEDLCTAQYANPELDAYFGRAVRFLNPRPPRSGSEYIENWAEFCEFVERARLKHSGRAAGPELSVGS